MVIYRGCGAGVASPLVPVKKKPSLGLHPFSVGHGELQPLRFLGSLNMIED